MRACSFSRFPIGFQQHSIFPYGYLYQSFTQRSRGVGVRVDEDLLAAGGSASDGGDVPTKVEPFFRHK